MEKIVKLFFIFTVTIILLQCGENKQDKDSKSEITLTFWHSLVSSSVPAFEKLVNDFENEFPGISIKSQYVPSGDALIQKLVTAIQSKTAPDISWLHADFMEDLVAADAIYKMEHFINGPDSMSQSDLRDIYPSLIQYASWRGTLYSMPMEATNLALLYNRQMFKEVGLDPDRPPKTWDELYEYAKKLSIDKDGDGNFERIGFFVPIFPASGPLGAWMVWQWLPYLWQGGGHLIDLEQTHVQFNSDAGVAALSLWAKLYHDFRLDLYTTDYDVFFTSERLAMTMDGPWNLPRYKDLLKHLDWAFAPLPAGPKKQATVVGGEYLAIFKQSKHPNEAWKFVKWFTRPDIQAKWGMLSGYLPIRSAVLNVPEFKEYLEKNPNYRVFVEQMEVGQAQRSIDFGGLEIGRNIAEAIEKVMVAKVNPRQALDEAAKKSNEILKSGKKDK